MTGGGGKQKSRNRVTDKSTGNRYIYILFFFA